jgi:GDP/UDP-N,N'-diacetylbacillosamine 2-epimerase (hydrolysing)
VRLVDRHQKKKIGSDVRRILSITGSRADYGLMEPVYRAIAACPQFEPHLAVTGMHLLPEFSSSLEQVREDKFGKLHELTSHAGEHSTFQMAQSIGREIIEFSVLVDRIKPDIVVVQGDRGEMLAAAIAAAHANVAVVHMSGGDFSGSIDDSVRNAISKFAHFHLTNCDASTRRLIAMGESADRILEIGDPAIDQLRVVDFLPMSELGPLLDLDGAKPFLLATLHPVTDEAEKGAAQMLTLLEALAEIEIATVFTYPNSDSGGSAMRDMLESWRSRAFLRIVPNLGSRRYLSLLRHAAAIVGNSSSGIVEAPTLKVPAINIGSRQHNRVRASNVIDVACEREAIVKAVRFALTDGRFRQKLAAVNSPYGDGHAAERTVDILRRLHLGNALVAKWKQAPSNAFLAASADAI